MAQTVEPGTAGFYTTKRKAVESFLSKGDSTLAKEDALFRKAVENASTDALEALQLPTPVAGDEESNVISTDATTQDMPLCDRCHSLVHHHVGVPIHHPSLDSIQETISESPHKYNHIYHVLDAADFPMSLIPRIQRILHLSPQRAKNRRSKHAKYSRGRLAELSFIITRSDLLAPKKEQVDRLMPYLTQVLRDALGSTGKEVRLGNVKCVSSKRGWWTKELKSDIWRRGGGGWMVGKVNVGKSNLFEMVFPKGHNDSVNIRSIRDKARLNAIAEIDDRHEDEIALRQHEEAEESKIEEDERMTDDLDMQSEWSDLLPPARAETPYPVMPTISSLPGTTASPIRIPFGGGRGELVDLPGLARGDLDTFVKPEARDSLVMKHRTTPEQYSIKHGQSLLLGGLIRIDPSFPSGSQREVVVLAYPFVPLRPHLTSSIKANEIQDGTRVSGVPMIIDEDGLKAMKSAGRFQLKWDVTKQRAGPLTTSSGIGLKAKVLPFTVLSTDLLIEGIGWVELVAQVRKRRSAAPDPNDVLDAGSSPEVESKPAGAREEALDEREQQQADRSSPDEEPFPEVEVFTPNGMGIGTRRPMGAWLLGGEKPSSAARTKTRPRRSMANTRTK